MARYVSLSDATSCPATTKAGIPCQVTYGIFGDDGRCQFHSEEPELVARLQQVRSLAGKNSRASDSDAPLIPPPDPKNIDDAREYLSWIARQAIHGALGHNQAQAATRAIKEWIMAEGYAAKIRELRRIVDDLKKAGKPRV